MPKNSLIAERKARQAASQLGTGAAAQGRDAILKRKKALQDQLAAIEKELG